MSNIIGEYKTINRFSDANESMSVTATVQGEYGKGVQITMHGEGMGYVVLAENQVRSLIEQLQKRLDAVEGFSATDTHEDEMFEPEKLISEDSE